MKFVLVTGCPRSGTTPLTAWLGLSPNVVSLCESRRTIAMHRLVEEARRFRSTSTELATIKTCLGMMARKLYDTGTAVVVDKEPLETIAFPGRDYVSYLENTVDVLDGKLLFMIREPVTTVHEIISRLWGYSLAQQNLEQRTTLEAIDIWKTATEIAIQYAGRENVRLQSYERLVEDSQHESIAICDFVGATLPHMEFPAKVIERQTTPEFRSLVEAETGELWAKVSELIKKSEAR